MSYWLISFIAGFLTVLAPCSLFLLPTILAGSTLEKNPARPWIITLSLGASVFLFSLLVKGTSLAFVVPDYFWSVFSGLLLGLFGLTLVFPKAWEYIGGKLHFFQSQTWLNKAGNRRDFWGSVFLGAALGPVFSTCSPTFAVLLAVLLPASLIQGVINIALFVVGMMIPFGLIGIGGQKVVQKFRFAANPHGWFRRSLGVILILVGIIIITGFQKVIEAKLIEFGYLGPISLEQRLLKGQQRDKEEKEEKKEIDSAIQRKFSEFKTDLSKNAIPFDKILSGGPGKDVIPALNNPEFVSIEETLLQEEDLGIFVNIDGEQRYYPFSILVWHEIVNDTLSGRAVAVTFCPLCGSAIVFDRKVNGKVLNFGVSGFLFESNLLMYDRESESFWSQVRGEAVAGEHTGTKLARIEMQRIPFKELKSTYPSARVLSTETGYKRDYSLNPYGDYDETDDLYFPVSIEDQRFPAKEMMFVVPINETWIAFPWKNLQKAGVARMSVQGKELVLTIEGSEVSIGYDGKSAPGYFEMWFSFATHHQKDGLVWAMEEKSDEN